MKVLITGGLGYVGAWLTERLSSSGFDVTTFSRNDRSDILRDCRFEKIFGSVENAADLKRLFFGRNWDAIIHLASVGASADSPDYAEKSLIVNALGTRNLLQAIAENGGAGETHFVYFSTFHVYGINSGVADEDKTFPAPRSDYAATHLFAEYYVRQFHRTHRIPFTVFRLTNGYGAPKNAGGGGAEWKLVLNDLARAAIEKNVVKLSSNGRPRRDFVWLGDVCDAVEKCLFKGAANEVFNLGSGSSISMSELAEAVKAAYEKKFAAPIAIEINQTDLNEYGDALAVSIEKLRGWIDFEPQNRLFDEATAIFDLLEKRGKN